MPSVPPIYAPRGPVQRVAPTYRALAAAIAVGCLTVLLIGAGLAPSSSGTGTHTSLGLQPCQFLYRTGLPCPSCGMTTSVTFLVHGNLLASLWVQPMGTVIGITLALTFWGAVYISFTGRPAHRLARIVPIGYYLLPLMFFAIAAWGWKIFIHWQGLDGWG